LYLFKQPVLYLAYLCIADGPRRVRHFMGGVMMFGRQFDDPMSHEV